MTEMGEQPEKKSTQRSVEETLYGGRGGKLIRFYLIPVTSEKSLSNDLRRKLRKSNAGSRGKCVYDSRKL